MGNWEAMKLTWAHGVPGNWEAWETHLTQGAMLLGAELGGNSTFEAAGTHLGIGSNVGRKHGGNAGKFESGEGFGNAFNSR